ncbi:MAG: cysteine desulfurase / selenocysteine lyase [Gammaproteobacteria bacterium]|nr:cysteine desulfurase / selenocysteine lyase [Gammaproteobacteria bacterium]
MSAHAELLQNTALLDVERIREDFPILKEKIHGKPLIYLDSAATSQKPKAVIDALVDYYSHYNANVHRAVHLLSTRATEACDRAREKVRRFINAPSTNEIIFVRGTTEGLNLVAQTYGRQNIKAGDEVLISGLEHHSNIVPWQMLCDEKQARLRVVHIDDRGVIPLDQFEKALNGCTRLVALAHVSNALGTVNPLPAMIEMAHRWNVPVVVDGAQAVPHMPVDVRALNADFYAFSGHKLFGPTGIGVLYGKQALLEAMPPFQGGGDMIRSVTFEKTEYNVLPYKFEAGTPDVAGIVGLGAAIDYVNTIGIDRIAAYESDLLEYASAAFSLLRGVQIIGTAPSKASVISFIIDGVHPHDVGTILDQEGIAVRTGHHCAQPVMDRFQIAATTRASLAFYNTTAEIDALIAGIRKVQEFFF